MSQSKEPWDAGPSHLLLASHNPRAPYSSKLLVRNCSNGIVILNFKHEIFFFVVTFINWWLKGWHLQVLVLPASRLPNGSLGLCLLALPFLCALVKVMRLYKSEDFFKIFGYIVRFEAFLLFIWLGWFFFLLVCKVA